MKIRDEKQQSRVGVFTSQRAKKSGDVTVVREQGDYSEWKENRKKSLYWTAPGMDHRFCGSAKKRNRTRRESPSPRRPINGGTRENRDTGIPISSVPLPLLLFSFSLILQIEQKKQMVEKVRTKVILSMLLLLRCCSAVQ